MSDDHAKFTQQVRALVAENDRVPVQRTADPMTQAIVAMCSHSPFEPDCPRCVARAREAAAHLVRLTDEVLAALEASVGGE